MAGSSTGLKQAAAAAAVVKLQAAGLCRLLQATAHRQRPTMAALHMQPVAHLQQHCCHQLPKLPSQQLLAQVKRQHTNCCICTCCCCTCFAAATAVCACCCLASLASALGLCLLLLLRRCLLLQLLQLVLTHQQHLQQTEQQQCGRQLGAQSSRL